MKSLLLATVAVAVMSGQAWAENQAFDWSGSYVGAEAGYGHSSMKFNGDDPDDDGTYNKDGFLGGIYAGHDWQAGNFVYGVVADFDGLSVPEVVFGGKSSDDYAYDIDWLASGRARLGYVPMDRLLVYGTGGIAAAHFDATNASFTAFGGPSKFSGVKWGGVFGAGVEYAFANNWSVKTEVLHYVFDGISVTPQDPIGLGIGPARFKPSLTAVKVGIAYRF